MQNVEHIGKIIFLPTMDEKSPVYLHKKKSVIESRRLFQNLETCAELSIINTNHKNCQKCIIKVIASSKLTSQNHLT